MEKCIDVSKHQTAFDAKKCKKAGVTTVIGRLAYSINADNTALNYISKAKEAGLNVGGYGFGTWHYQKRNNHSPDKARVIMQEQVSKWIELAKDAGCTSWLAIDQECESGQSMALGKINNTTLLNEAAKLIEDAGLHPCLYASASWIQEYVDLNEFKYPLWVAYYKNGNKDKDFADVSSDFPNTKYGEWMTEYQDRICLWQFTSSGYADKYGCTHGSNSLDKNQLYFQPESWQGITEPVIEYYPQYTGKTYSLVNALNSLDVDSSFAHRRKIAIANNIVTVASKYIGTPTQNLKMLDLLKKGQLIKA